MAAKNFVCARPDKVDPPPSTLPADRAAGAATAAPVTRSAALPAPACAQTAAPLHAAVLLERVSYAASPLILLTGIMLMLVLLVVLHSTEAPGAALFGMLGAAAIVIPLVRFFLPPGGAGLGRLVWAAIWAGLLTAMIHLVLIVRIDFVGVLPANWRISHDVHRTRLGRWHSFVLRITTILAILLLVAGFGHEAVWLLADPDGGALATAARKAGGWGALLVAVASAAFTAYKALPTSRAKDSAEGLSPVSRAIIRVAPYIVVLVLAILLAGLGHWVIARWTLQPPDVIRLAWLVLAASVLQLGFALYEWVRDLIKDGRDWTLLGWLTAISTFVLALGAAIGVRHLLSHRWDASASDPLMTIVTCGWIGLVFTLSFVALEAARRAAGQFRWPVGEWALQALNGRAMLLMFLAAGGFAGPVIFARFGTGPQLADALALLPWALGALVVLSAAWVVGIGWMADPNLLSMHAFYQSRLVRAYLGASNTGRSTEITDTARGDDVLLQDLWNHDQAMPYHLVNTTLNLVGAPDLATSQRSAANFVLSKYYCGSARTGYQRTQDYMDGQLTLGTAVAISGAAASPNMGSKNPGAALAALLALLNVRLGFWAPNPGLRRWRERQARLWPFYLVYEFLSQTNDNGSYCYLTDGGHFDNTGLYALVERGCRYIMVLDCGADPTLQFEDIGQAIRRCRIDFGTEISLDVNGFLERDTADPDEKRVRRRHVVVGDIIYGEEHWRMLGWPPTPEPGRTGRLVWIKPSVIRRDAADVRQYHRQNLAFPHQTTMDQWYDESQFEAYRQLGFYSVLSFFSRQPVPQPNDRPAIRNFFDGLASP